MRTPDRSFWKGRRVLVTGHTGFKGSWLLLMLEALGARVSGFALPPPKGHSAYRLLDASRSASGWTGDIRDAAAIRDLIEKSRPEIVIHLAAQAIVARALEAPAETFSVNVGGTAAVLEALSRQSGWQAAVVVTSDKVYKNDGSGRPFAEGDALGGDDPYSASKAACEFTVAAFAASCAMPGELATARAGNVVGGGDFGECRLLPDLFRADEARRPLLLRRPGATRPFQSVLDVLVGYLLLAEDLCCTPRETPRALNFGPEGAELTVGEVVQIYGDALGRPVLWERVPGEPMPEAQALALDSRLARTVLGWEPSRSPSEAIAETARWHADWFGGADLAALSRRAVREAIGA
jgi:CDP-glucose 4,6-dehydratase